MNHLSKIQAAALQLRLYRCCADVPAIQLMLLSTVDGFQLVTAGSRRDDPELPEKFAAMASSMSALAAAAGKELGSKEHLEAVVLDLIDLRVILRMVNSAQQQFVLATVADRQTSLGPLLKIIYENARLLEEVLH
ncbi:MAG: hypothetical protein LBB65_04290 [Burkholderiales bacterium]|jgi:predicted regulator of Ras-like GTPase activity (Roadblock/LC7/MglB family)|nr:hypothetical protein [Burkholderiales bacterium]